MLTEMIQGLEIPYKIQKRKSDRKHLLVIFSGFRAHGTFDFGGKALKNISSEILWIDDTFDGFYSYYILSSQGKDISERINTFIESHLDRLGISKQECTLAGFSKGGSAALYYLAKYGYKNAVITVPQFKIASYIKNNSPREISPMFGAEDSELFLAGDSIITDAITRDEDKNKNIYLYTSPSDVQYKTEILPHLKYLKSYANFNYVVSDTPLIRQHDQVTRYNVPTIIAVLSLLTEGIVPRFGSVTNGSPRVSLNATGKRPNNPPALSKLNKFSVIGNKLFIEGEVVFRGHPSLGYSSQKTAALFESQNGVISIPLGHDRNNLINSRYYEDEFIDYSYSKFATRKYQGINLDNFPFGKFKFSINSMHENGVEATLSKYSLRKKSDIYFTDDYVINTICEDDSVYLLKRRYEELDSFKNELRIDQFEIKSQRLYLKGLFAPMSFNFGEWSSIQYKIRFEDTAKGTSYIYSLANASRPYESTLSSEKHFDKSKAYFATKSYRGIDLSELMSGSYVVSLVASFGSHVILETLSDVLEVSSTALELKPVIAVVGSCVSRDLFNSRLNRGWKEYMSIGPEHYQMSLISLMSQPIEFETQLFSDLSPHDLAATSRDFSKKFLDEMTNTPPDYILIDLFADSRFDVIEFEDSIVTDNSWKIGKSQAYNKFDEMRRISPTIDAEEYFELFESACRRFREFLLKNCPKTKVILNSCRASLTWQSISASGAFNTSAIKIQNLRWARLERILIGLLNPKIIDSTKKIISGDPEHPWGLGPVHYEPTFYRTLSRELFSEIYSADSPFAKLQIQIN